MWSIKELGLILLIGSDIFISCFDKYAFQSLKFSFLGTKFSKLFHVNIPIQISSTMLLISSNVNVNEEDVKNKTSVHLKLTERLDKEPDHVGKSINETKTNIVDVFEVRDNDSNQSISIIGEVQYLHIFAKQYFGLSNLKHTKWKANLKDSQDIAKLTSIWKDGRLLSKSEKFPYDSRQVMKSFVANVRNSVTRMRSLLKDLNRSEGIIQYLQQQNISNTSYNQFVYNPKLSYNESIIRLKSFAAWFRSEFPYYIDKCESCGNTDGNHYSGVLCPSAEELKYQARVVETYVCSNCSYMTKFSRFNDVEKVLHTKKGRCGEYSALIVRMLKALQYKTRWVTDIADHLWAEVLIQDKWIHFDPCEAAVDEPYIYQGWGKNQTYIVAYDCQSRNATDVTHTYTSKLDGIYSRRQADGMNSSYISKVLIEASKNLSALA